MKEIPLTQGKVALVDDEDYEALSKFKWAAHKCGKRWYADRHEKGKTAKTRKYIRMHRDILCVPPELDVDHINNNGLDNRRRNLRWATREENCRNQAKHSDNTSGWKGVYWDKTHNKYAAQIRWNHKIIRLGRFTDPVEAAHAYDEAAKKYHGEFAKLNFPE